MKWFIILCSLFCALLISQIALAQPEVPYDYDWSRDGSRFVVTVYGAATAVYDAEGQLLASRTGTVYNALLSPDGNSLLVRLGETTEIWDAETLQTLRVLPVGVGWSPDGSELVSTNPISPWGKKFYSAADGSLLREFTTADAIGWSGAGPWSPDGAYFVSCRASLILLDATTGVQIGPYYELDGSSEDDCYWSPDSTRIAIRLLKKIPTAVDGSFQSGDNHYLYTIDLFEISTGTFTTIQSGFRSAGDLVWSPDSTQIAMWIGANSQEIDLTILDAASGNVIKSFNRPSVSRLLGFSPWGGRLLTGSYYSQSEYPPPVLDELIQIIVPLATLARFAEIAASCGAPNTLTDFDTSLTDPAAIAAQAQILLAQLDALPEGTIPPGCAADLRAIAEAIQAETPRERRE